VAEQLEEIKTRLGDLDRRVQECRAAVDTAHDGDPSALDELEDQVDVMAEDVAALKAAMASFRL